jgi:hypothetical protein
MNMTKRGIQESNSIFGKDGTGKCEVHKMRMPIIKCACGFEILVVPDLKAMNQAIKNHVIKHKKACSKRITDFLTEKVLIAASQINLA